MELKEFIKSRGIPVLATSLVSDKNCGLSTYIDRNTVTAISDDEGILEVEL